MSNLKETVHDLLSNFTFVERDINTKNDFMAIICPDHGHYYKTVREILEDDPACPKCDFLSEDRMKAILEEAQLTLNLDDEEDLDNKPAVYYRLLIEHKRSGILFQKVGIADGLTEFAEFWNPWKWKDFNIEVIDKIECSRSEAETIQSMFQEKHAKRKITIPSYMKFNLNKTYEWDEIWLAKSKSIKELRDIYLIKQKNKCTICNLPVENPTLDHMHQKKVKGTGFIRAVCCSQCNTFIARSENNAARHGISQSRLPDVLRRMADHLENQTKIIHPTEAPKRKKVGVRAWNKVKKYYFKAYPNKKVLPKKPTYVTESWLQMERDIEEYLLELEKSKLNKKQERDTK